MAKLKGIFSLILSSMMFAFMTFKMNFNSTVIWRQFSTVSLFLWLKMCLSHWQVMSKVYVSKLNFLSVLDNQFWRTVFASFLKVSPQIDVFSTVKISQCNTFHWKGLRHDESMVFHSCSSVEYWRVAVVLKTGLSSWLFFCGQSQSCLQLHWVMGETVFTLRVKLKKRTIQCKIPYKYQLQNKMQ